MVRRGPFVALLMVLTLGAAGLPADALQVGPATLGAVHISAGQEHSCAVTTLKTLHCWGDSAYGQTKPSLAADVRQVAAGRLHTCILRDSGDVDCWGREEGGSTSPYRGGDAVAVAAGASTNCVVTSAADLNCWGFDLHGQAPDSDAGDVVEVAPAVFHTCWLVESGDVHCAGTEPGRAQIPGRTLGDATDVATGFRFTCIRTNDARVTCYDGYGTRLGHGTPDTLDIAAKGDTVCALRTADRVRCWSPMGVGFTMNVVVPGAKQVAAGWQHACVRTGSDDVRCFGDNTHGQSFGFPLP